MAITKIRTNTTGLQSGYKMEVTEGTALTLVAADFINDATMGPIQQKSTVVKFGAGGSTGTDRLFTSKVYGELNTFELPLYMGQEADILKVGGAYVTVNASPVSTDYSFGGTIYSGLASPDKGRISNKCLTLQQMTNGNLVTLYGAKTATLKIGAKNGEYVKLSASFNGQYSSVASATTLTQVRSSSKVNLLKNSSVTLNGKVLAYTDIEIDFKPKLKMVEDAGSTTGYAQAEITDLDPVITINPYVGDTAVIDLVAQLLSANDPVPFVWTFGVGTGNVYTVTALVQIDTQENSYDDNVLVSKLTLIPVYNSAKTYKVNINIA